MSATAPHIQPEFTLDLFLETKSHRNLSATLGDFASVPLPSPKRISACVTMKDKKDSHNEVKRIASNLHAQACQKCRLMRAGLSVFSDSACQVKFLVLHDVRTAALMDCRWASTKDRGTQQATSPLKLSLQELVESQDGALQWSRNVKKSRRVSKSHKTYTWSL